MKKIFYFLLVMFTGFSMQFDSFNGKVYFDRKAENEIVRTDNINLGIDISSKEYDVVVFEFINFSDIKQEGININEKNSLKLKLKNYDILFLKEDIQKYLDEKELKVKIPNQMENVTYKDWVKKYFGIERAITKLFNSGRFKAIDKNKQEVSGFQNGYFNTVFCYYTKTNTCSQGNYYSVADKNNEIIWYDEYRFSYDRIEDWNTIQKYLMENHNIEIKKKYSK